MKYCIAALAALTLYAGCEQKVEPAAGGTPVVEKNTTVINPPAPEEKKTETNTTIVTPPAAAPKQ